jgi:catechol 2,3-dioxygenase-like lactoylglutathione lyase family enzyme
VKLDHVRLAVKNWQLSWDWYVDNFGFKVEFQIPDGGTERRGVAARQDEAGLTLFLEGTPHPCNGCGCIYYL